MRLRSFPAAAVAAALVPVLSLLGATAGAAQTASQPTVSVVPLAPVGPTSSTLPGGVSLVPAGPGLPGGPSTPVLPVVPGAAGPGEVATSTAVAGPPTALLVTGRGFGHGRGLSQWGAFGYARMGWDRSRILDRYYGGTVRGAVSPSSSIGVRLMARDGKALVVYNPKGRVYTAVPGQNGYTVPPALAAAAVAAGLVADPTTTTSPTAVVTDAAGAAPAVGGVAVVAAGPSIPPSGGGATPAGAAAVLTGSGAAVRILLGAGGTWQISDGPGCNGPWTPRVPVAASAVTVSPGPADPAIGPDDPDGMLQLCESAATRRVYRGDLLTVDGKPGQRTVNVVGLEPYLRGVLPREIHAAWADTAPEAIAAQAVAARSYAAAERRSTYANTCDTIDCQVYRGRGTVDGGRFTSLEDPRTDRAVVVTAGEIRVDPKTGKPVRTEFNSSSGGHTAPGQFPAVRDEGDDVPENPHRSWTVAVPRAKLESGRRLGTLRGAVVLARDGFGEGGGRVTQLQLQFSGGNVLVSGAEFMRTLGLKSSWFDVTTTTDPRYGGFKVVAAAPALTGDAGPGDAVLAATAATGTRSLVRTTTTVRGRAATTKAPRTTKATAPRATVSVTPVTEAAPPPNGPVVLVAAAAVRSVDGSTGSGSAARGVRVTTTTVRP